MCMQFYDLQIIIPIYNVETYLEQCLKSVVCQLDEGMERPVQAFRSGNNRDAPVHRQHFLPENRSPP